jgi:hypothetical protein
MADSPELRARRHRLHSRGDHSLCKIGRCAEAGTVATADVRELAAAPGDARAHQRCIAAAAEVAVIFGGKWRDCGNARCSNAPVPCRVLQARFR